MIIDTIENLGNYVAMNPLFADVVEFLKANDLNKMEPGKYPIKDKDLFLNLTIAKGRGKDAAVLETHIGMIDKLDAVEVIHFAFLIIGNCPQVANAVQTRLLTIGGSNLDMYHLLSLGIGQVVHHSKLLFPVDTYECCQVVEVKLFLERSCKSVPLCIGHGNQQELAAGVALSLGT